MRRFIGLFAATAVALPACTSSPASEVDLAQGEARESYSLGSAIGEQLVQSISDVDREAFLAGIGDAVRGQPRLTPDQITLALHSREEAAMEEARAEAQATAERNGKAGDLYRKEFGGDPETVTLASGLQYRVLVEGEGETPGPDDTVKVHYRGSFVDGSEFDSSYTRQTPAELPVGRLIPGWSEALQLMPVGSKWQIVIPPDLAYGDEGAGDLIEPGSTLVFEMELLEVVS